MDLKKSKPFEFNSKINLKEMPISINIRKVLIVIILFISAIILDVILRVCFPPIKMTLSKENYTSYKTAINFLEFSSSLINRHILIAISLIIYLFCNKLKFFIIVSAYYSTDIIGQLLKIIYQIPRESWSDNYRIENCVGVSGGFANPSGHSLTSIFFYLALYKVIISSINKYINSVVKYLILAFFILMILFIILSRFILGYHTLSQIIFGASIGLLMFYTTFYILFKNLNDFRILLKLMQNKWTVTTFLIIYFFATIISALIYFFFSNWSINAWYYFKLKNCKKTNSTILFNEEIISLFYFYTYFGTNFFNT